MASAWMRGPNGVAVATAGAGAFVSTPQCLQRLGKAPVADDVGFDWRQLDLVVFAD
jgi:hypothetical protein